MLRHTSSENCDHSECVCGWCVRQRQTETETESELERESVCVCACVRGLCVTKTVQPNSQPTKQPTNQTTKQPNNQAQPSVRQRSSSGSRSRESGHTHSCVSASRETHSCPCGHDTFTGQPTHSSVVSGRTMNLSSPSTPSVPVRQRHRHCVGSIRSSVEQMAARVPSSSTAGARTREGNVG